MYAKGCEQDVLQEMAIAILLPSIFLYEYLLEYMQSASRPSLSREIDRLQDAQGEKDIRASRVAKGIASHGSQS